MKKVLIVTALGGFIRAFLKDDIKILQKMGYEVHCAANNNDSGLNGFYNQLGVIAHHIDMDSSKPLSYETLVSYKQLKKLIESNSYDAIHCHTPIAGALSRLAGRKMRKKGTKIIYTTHGFYFHKGSSRRSWLIYYNIEKFVSRFTDVIITINQEDYQAAKTMLCRDVRYINGVGINTDKFITTVIDKAQYRDLLGVDRDAIMILSIGELSVRKNHQIIIHALSKVKYNNIVYVICGTGINGEGTAKDLEELAEKLKVNLVLLGLRNDIAEICKCADIGAFPSTREGLGLAGLEMLASGLPLVASNIHGIKDYVKNNINGFSYSPFDSEGFAKGISTLINSDIREEMKLKCIDSVKNFDKSHTIQQMERIYYDVL